MIILRGSVSEWFKEHAWKACVRATVPEVRILSLPPGSKKEDPLGVLFFASSSEDARGSISSINHKVRSGNIRILGCLHSR